MSLGSTSTRRRYSAWMRLGKGNLLGTAKPPAKAADERPRESSSKASGLPRASARIRPRTNLSNGPSVADVTSSAASVFGQAAETQLRQPLELTQGVPVALGKDDDHRLHVKPPRDEGEHLGRGPVQPLGVIDEADQRPRVGELGELAQQGEPHEEAIGRLPRR